MCVLVRESSGERERERTEENQSKGVSTCEGGIVRTCGCVYVCIREKDRMSKRPRGKDSASKSKSEGKRERKKDRARESACA